ncbi:MAG: agmatinase [Planctomycetota bacterium]
MSKEELFQAPWNFLGLPEEISSPERARGWLLSIPYESTTSYGAGTREGPAAIIAASRQVELFDREFGCEPAMQYGVHTMRPLALVVSSPDAMVGAVEEAVRAVLSGEPRPEALGILGGEHSISAGTARALGELVGKDTLVCVQIDAHADLRDEYEGSPLSHACVARRILDVCPVFQIGIRNVSEGGEQFRKGSKRLTTVFAEEAASEKGEFLGQLAAFVEGKTVFLTIDLDGLDPSIMPAVGTPEPEGISWKRTLEIVRVVSESAARVPAFDVVELAPIPGLRAPDFLAAKLTYRVFSTLLRRRSTVR